MHNREKISKNPHYEVKYSGENRWTKVSEKEFLADLQKSHTLITPILKRMFDGEEIATPAVIFRIRTRS